MALWVFSVLFLLALLVHSSALYCICQDGVGTQALQKAIDYACGNGADCTSIQQNGPCYLPNTVKDHCNYAVNSYYQMEVSSGGTCDFSGVATTSSTPPSTASSGCVYPSSSSNGTTGTSPSLTPPTAITPDTGAGTPESPNFGTSPSSSTTNGATVVALESAYTKLLLPLLLTTAWLALRV
ncbi:hypothetical protein TanjilG_09377 [Lupinus angustifolius]|uniref:X8 domain-containing protein n=1 Tax=Lupinus angustifolius TaxID=3871 RepID=A0A1J7G1N8_LUPAN|nr:PREDICTED: PLASMODESMATA CALLOSE-BINDING PROTEIN 4-like [Lupinus angustifolius]OIV94222.1 hypothetical protein TanjilG_09377 [Lupinus angustifolius]